MPVRAGREPAAKGLCCALIVGGGPAPFTLFRLPIPSSMYASDLENKSFCSGWSVNCLTIELLVEEGRMKACNNLRGVMR